jgi:hypothetical protein
VVFGEEALGAVARGFDGQSNLVFGCVWTPAAPGAKTVAEHYDLGISADGANGVQQGLDFSDQLPELFEGGDMGEDALRVLGECLKLRKTVLDEVKAEMNHVREAMKWAGHLK